MRTQAVVFSKDRALQLRATLESLLLRCTDAAEELRVRVLYKACGEMHRRQYDSLKESFPQVEFVAETDFRIQLLRLLADTPYVLFLVDDNIFYRDFSLGGVLECLEAAPGAVGFSLRLGRNTTYCHTQDAPQRVPGCTVLRDNVLCCRWRGADHDFGYPLEVSSSVYRTAHMLALLHDMPFTNPNLLEAGLSRRTGAVEDSFPQLLFFDRSVTFCNPLNRVQDTFANRVADEPVTRRRWRSCTRADRCWMWRHTVTPCLTRHITKCLCGCGLCPQSRSICQLRTGRLFPRSSLCSTGRRFCPMPCAAFTGSAMNPWKSS